jgi:hypothetical protein
MKRTTNARRPRGPGMYVIMCSGEPDGGEENKRGAGAPLMKKPIILFDINSSGSKAYLSLAQEIMTK